MGDDKERGQQLGKQLLTLVRSEAEAAGKKPDSPLVLNGLSELIEAVMSLSSGPVDLSAIVEAISKLQLRVDNHVDLSRLDDAIEMLALKDSDVHVDLSAITESISALSVDMSGVENQLGKLATAVEKNNEILQALVNVASKPKKVTYDSQGRVTSVGVS